MLLLFFLCYIQPSITIQEIPCPSRGSVLVTYENTTAGKYRLLGVDINSESYIFYDQFNDVSYIKTANGMFFKSRIGESEYIESLDTPFSIYNFSDQFPFLIIRGLRTLESDRLHIETTENGQYVVEVDLVKGDLAMTLSGHEFGELQTVRYTIDPSGRVDSVYNSTTGEIHNFVYADADYPLLAPAQSWNYNVPNGVAISSIAIIPDGDPNLFQPKNFIQDIHELTLKNAERTREIVQSNLDDPQVAKQLLKDSRPGWSVGNFSVRQLALILTGLLVIGVGSLAWWKNRS